MKLGQMTLVTAIMLGLSVLALPQASYGLHCSMCSCSSSCDAPCRYGPFVIDCPECNMTTCGEWGMCVGSCVDECSATTSTIYGTSGGDTLNGTSANDLIYGYEGADTIYGHAGDDTIYAGSGNDTVYGGSGDDCIYGEGGNDNLVGDTGASDFADGGSGTDTCNAESEINCEI